MSKPSVILVGAGGHCHACIDVIESQGRYQIAGLIGSADELHSQHLGYTVMGTDADLPQLAESGKFILIAVGQIQSPEIRIRLFQQACRLGFQWPVIIAPTAYVSRHAHIGAGSIILHGAIVNAGASVGQNCIVNSRALIEHDATVADHCHISTGAILNGHVRIGSGSFVGSASVVKEGIAVGNRCFIGMGLAVRHSLPDQSQYFGQQ